VCSPLFMPWDVLLRWGVCWIHWQFFWQMTLWLIKDRFMQESCLVDLIEKERCMQNRDIFFFHPDLDLSDTYRFPSLQAKHINICLSMAHCSQCFHTRQQEQKLTPPTLIDIMSIPHLMSVIQLLQHTCSGLDFIIRPMEINDLNPVVRFTEVSPLLCS